MSTERIKPLVIPRLPGASMVVVACVLVGHFFLCYPAAVSRGYPSIHPFWESVAPFVGFLGVVPCLLLDDSPTARRRLRFGLLPLLTMMTALVWAGPMPRTGSLHGPIGVLVGNFSLVVISMVFLLILTLPAFIVMEMAAVAGWNRVRQFSDPDGAGPHFRFTSAGLLGLVTLVACVCGGAVWGVRAYHNWPHAGWSEDCRNNLKTIGLAMHSYYDANGSLPPAWVEDSNGRPMHSWRVLLLPYLGEQKLYDAYDFSEPWDGPHNRTLLARMPAVYRCRWHKQWKQGCTNYVVITGDETAFPGARGRKYREFADGTSRTVLIVEASGSDVPWTAPDDLRFDAMPTRVGCAEDDCLYTSHRGPTGYVQVVLVDGSFTTWHSFTSADELKAAVTANGGESIAPPF